MGISRHDFETVPKTDTHLRACLVCSLLKIFEQFECNGCENCESFLHMAGNRDRVYELTSANYSGLISLIQPTDSWVGRWQSLKHCRPGCYAISVTGNLPKSIER